MVVVDFSIYMANNLLASVMNKYIGRGVFIMLWKDFKKHFFSAYPLFLFHRQYLRRCSPAVQHVFFAISGMVLANWSIGTECLMHSCAMIGVTWATLKVFQGSMPSTIFLYIFNVRNSCKIVISIFKGFKTKTFERVTYILFL